MSNSKTDNKAIAYAEKQRQALELRKAGLTFEEIAAKLGYATHVGAYQAVKSAIRKIIKEPAEEVRDLEVARLDAMLAGLWVDARKGNVLKVDRVLKIMSRRAELLGLDAPKKYEDVTDHRKEAEAIAAEIGKPELVDQIEQDLLISQTSR